MTSSYTMFKLLMESHYQYLTQGVYVSSCVSDRSCLSLNKSSLSCVLFTE